MTWIDPHGFLNKPADPATGLTDVGAREYDPVTGQFISPDPVLDPASPQDLDPYAYALDNPVTNSDPTGLRVPTDGGGCPSYDPGCPGYKGPGGPTAGAGGYTPPPDSGTSSYTGGGSSASSCPDYLPGCPGFTGGGAGQAGESTIGPGYTKPPVYVAPTPVVQSITNGQIDCSGPVFHLGGCPSESAAAGSTPQQVKQSFLGALILLSGTIAAPLAGPLVDAFGDAFGSAGEGAGAAAEDAGTAGGDLTRVGRWMSPAEHGAMTDTGTVQEGAGGVTNVASPADPEAYMRQAVSGSRYVEFDVPQDSLSPGGKVGWASIRGPNSFWSRAGLALPEMPPALNIEWLLTKP